MAYNNGGGYNRGNNQGGGGYRGGNRGGSGYSGGGSRPNSGNNRGSANGNSGAGNGTSDYVRSSTFVRKVKFENENRPDEKVFMEFGITEETNITLTADKAQHMIEVLQKAVQSPDGDGGVRITMYSQRKSNEQTGEEFDSMNMLILGKYPPNKDRGQNFDRKPQQQGRRDYPKQEQATPTGPMQRDGVKGRGTTTSSTRDGSPQQMPVNDPRYNAGPLTDNSFAADDIPF